MIVQIRVDDRLIHGQVAVIWSKHYGTTHMVVANDRAAENEVQQMTLKMATPNGVKVLIKSVEDSIKVFNDPRSQNVRMFVLTDTCKDALEIAKHCKVDSINVANVGRFESADQKLQINRDVGVNPGELEALKEIAKLDCETIHWTIPTNPKVTIEKMLEGIK